MRSLGPSNSSNHVDTTNSNNMQITDRIGRVRPFLDRVLDRRTDDTDPLAIERRRSGDEDGEIQTLGPFDGLVGVGGDVVVAAGLEHSTSTFTGFSAGWDVYNATICLFQDGAAAKRG